MELSVSMIFYEKNGCFFGLAIKNVGRVACASEMPSKSYDSGEKSSDFLMLGSSEIS